MQATKRRIEKDEDDDDDGDDEDDDDEDEDGRYELDDIFLPPILVGGGEPGDDTPRNIYQYEGKERAIPSGECVLRPHSAFQAMGAGGRGRPDWSCRGSFPSQSEFPISTVKSDRDETN